MKFREVRELVPGTKYRIITLRSFHFNGTYAFKNDRQYIFNKVKGFLTSIPTDNKLFVNDVKTNRFYEPILGKFQTAMEERALQLILKSIIGDDSFVW
jgi:hypothetical protein